MENIEKSEVVINEPETKDNNNSIKMEDISKIVDAKVETKMGEFLKEFIKNNGTNQEQTQNNDRENQENSKEGELDSWRI